MMSRFKLIPEVHLVLLRDGKVLMLRRFNTGYEDGKYSLVAGHVDGGETFRSAMAREAQEEAGLEIAPAALRLLHTMHRNSDEERVSLYFGVDAWSGEPVNTEPHKCDDMRWFALTELPQNTVPYIRVALASINDDVAYLEFGWAGD
ncbi:MAG: NUDIX hydrolase [Hyphomonas sp. BRH_c22]|nr:MAG: NUDIX hydrolase [Hyphomonas sp. BRH_c22]